MGLFNKYPYTDFHELNIDWVLAEIKKLEYNLSNFVKINTIKYADPILWDITSQYEANTVVIDAKTGDAYISTVPVPSGVSIKNTDYWTSIFNYDERVGLLEDNVNKIEGDVNELNIKVTDLSTYVTPEMYGATGDGEEHIIDGIDLELKAINDALASGKNVVMNNTYKITGTIVIENTDTLTLSASSSIIKYTGTDFAVKIRRCNGCNLTFGDIQAFNGSCIDMSSPTGYDRNIYCYVKFRLMRCLHKCFYVNVTSDGYSNNNFVYGGQMSRGEYGVYIEADGTNNISSWLFDNVAFEGPDTCIYLRSIKPTRIGAVTFKNTRYIEYATSTLLNIGGFIQNFTLDSWGEINQDRIIIEPYTSLANVRLYAPVSDGSKIVAIGIEYNESNKEYLYRQIVETLTLPFSEGSTTGGYNTSHKYGHIVIINFSNVRLASTSGVLINANVAPIPLGDYECSLINDNNDGQARIYISKNTGEVKYSCSTGTVGKQLFGQLVYFSH